MVVGSSFQTPDGLTITPLDTYIADSTVHCVTDPMNMVYCYNIGNSLWSASLDLLKYLKDEKIIGQDGAVAHNSKSNVIEVGAGCGSVGLVLWKNGYRVSITDMDEMMPIMSENIRYNQCHDSNEKQQEAESGNDNSIEAIPLDWTNPSSAECIYKNRGPFKYVLGAEISYDESLHESFVDTLLVLCGRASSSSSSIIRSSNEETIIFLAIPQRDDDENIIKVATSKGFKSKLVRVIQPNNQHASSVVIYELKLGTQSSKKKQTNSKTTTTKRKVLPVASEASSSNEGVSKSRSKEIGEEQTNLKKPKKSAKGKKGRG